MTQAALLQGIAWLDGMHCLTALGPIRFLQWKQYQTDSTTRLEQ